MTRKIQSRSEKELRAGAMIEELPGRKSAAKRRPAPRTVTPEERHGMIAEAAYLRAEKRGFQSGNALDDWLQAEAEVDARLMGAG